MIYPIHTPLIIQKIFPSILWRFQIKPTEKKLYLTFDDGPIPIITPWVLGLLKQYEAKATFFCVGANVEKNPLIFEQIKKQGHSVGNHTYHHLNGWKTKQKHYIKNIEKCQKLTQTNLFRPPYGKLRPAQLIYLQNNDYQLVMWDVIAGDFDPAIDSKKCSQNIIKNTKNGAIIVLHDSQKAWGRLEYTLPTILEYYSNLGFKFCKIDAKTKAF